MKSDMSSINFHTRENATYARTRSDTDDRLSAPILDPTVTKTKKPKVIGWREWVALPDLAVAEIKAKVDTGADNSSLHAFNIDRFVEDDREMVRFDVHTRQRKRKPSVSCVAEVVAERRVKNPGGRIEVRPVIKTKLDRRWRGDRRFGQSDDS